VYLQIVNDGFNGKNVAPTYKLARRGSTKSIEFSHIVDTMSPGFMSSFIKALANLTLPF